MPIALLNKCISQLEKSPDVHTAVDDLVPGYAGINAIRGYHFDMSKLTKIFPWHLTQRVRATADGCW